MKKEKLIIIGAGLSALYAAYCLQDTYEITILEARDRIGGRIFGIEGHDMGPSWIWSHQKEILALVNTLGLELFSQHTQGLALYDAPDGLQRFSPQAQAPSIRMKGGLSALIDALYQKLKEDTVQLNQEVLSITQENDILCVTSTKQSYHASKVLCTLPPRLAVQSITYKPKLSDDSIHKMQNTPTWMGHTAKCVMTFSKAFWKEQGLSGFVFSPIGPLGEIHDACTTHKAALFGFVNSQSSHEKLKEAVQIQVQRLFGSDAKFLEDIYIVDWREERFTAVQADKQGLREHPNYGLDIDAYNHNLHFVSTESSFTEGGYLEGAIISAKNIANILKRRV